MPMTIAELIAILRKQPQDGSVLCKYGCLYVYDKNGKGLLEVDPDDKENGARPYTG